MYKLEIYLDNGLNAKYSNLTMEQVLNEIKECEGIESILITLESWEAK